MDKKILNQAVIHGCIAGTDGGDQNHKIVKVLAIIMFIFGLIGLLFPIITVICWGLALLMLWLVKRSQKVIQAITEKKYVLVEDVCVRNGISRTTEGPDSPYLEFTKVGHVELSFPHAVLNSQAVLASPDLSSTTNVGDTFYLLQADGRVLYIFNSRFWQLSEEDFTKTGSQLFPVSLSRQA